MSTMVISDPGMGGRGEPVVADRALYADLSLSRLVDEQDAAIVVVSHAGKVIPPAYVDALDLVVDAKGRVVQRGAVKERAAGANKERKSGRSKRDEQPAD